MTVFEKCRFSGKVSENRFHIPLFGIVLIFRDISVYIKKFKNYSTGFQAVTYPTLIVCKSISCVNFVDMNIFYTKRPDDKILLYLLNINTLQENPTFRTIRSSGPIDWSSRPGVYIYNRYVNFLQKSDRKTCTFQNVFVILPPKGVRNRSERDMLKIFKI